MPVPGSKMNIKCKWVLKFHCSNRKQAQGKTNKQTNKKQEQQQQKKNKAKQNNTVNFSSPVSIYIKVVIVDVDLIKIPRVGVSFFPKVF